MSGNMDKMAALLVKSQALSLLSPGGCIFLTNPLF
jgi:hypothetical protein